MTAEAANGTPGNKRAYRMGKRALTVQETRAAILQAARELLGEPSSRSISVDDIARKAGVARATVYYQFRTKVGLFTEVVWYVGERAGMDAVLRLRDEPDAGIALREYVRNIMTFWEGEQLVFRNIVGLASLDADVREITDAADARRRGLIAALVQRLRDAGMLREGIDDAYATNAIWLVTNFASYDQLCRRGKATVDEAIDMLFTMLEHLVAR